MIASHCLERGKADRAAVRDARGTWTYAELAAKSETVAARLGSLGGARIGLQLDRTRESVAVLLGVLRAGGVIVPFSLKGTPREIDYQVADAGIARTVSLADQAALLEGAAGFEGPSPGATAAASILYTSGTTGRPKGVVHTHAALAWQVDVLHAAWGWSPSDRLLHVLPLHHVHGLINGVLGALRAGAELRFVETFDAARIWDALSSGEVTVFYAVPTIYHQLADAWDAAPGEAQARWREGTAAMRLLVSGSAALPARLWHRWREITGQPLLERYGMTEIGMAISNPYRGERRPGTVGQPLPSMEVRIVDEEFRDVAPGLPGQIVVRGPSLFREYWGRPAETAAAFRDGWFLTGDVAILRDGYVAIQGRASQDILKSAGYKLSALEIEEVVGEHPGVREVAVVGMPDAEWGEVVTACVVLKPGASLSLEQLRDFCKDKLAPYKVPRRLRVCDSFPRTPLGKVVKKALLEPAPEAASGKPVSTQSQEGHKARDG